MIDIKSFGVSQNTNKSGGTTTISSTYGSDYKFFPVYLWGQYFDDTQDIDGDMKVNGTIEADAIKTLELEAEGMTVDNLDVKERLTAAAGNIKDLESKNFKADKANLQNALIKELAANNLVAENLTVTGSAHFFELIIDKIRAAGGAILLTPADGFKIDKVEWIDDTHCKLWWRSEKDGRKIHNMWMTGDQAISQNFNDAKVGKTYDVSNKYWWALVTETNNDTNNGEPVTTTINNEEVDCHYIIVSAAKNEFVGDVNPEIDDEVAMLGSRVDDENRQCAQYLAAYASLDIDLKAPLFAQYKGIDDFDLASHKITWFASGLTAAGVVKGLRENEITGSFRTSDGKSIEDLIDEAKAGTNYRLISNTTAIRKSSDGTLSPTTVSFSILMNENGDVNSLNAVPETMSVYINDTNTNTRIKTFNAGDTMNVQTSELASYANMTAVLATTTSGNVHDKISISVIEDQNIDIDITGDLTTFDRLVDNGCLAKVKFETDGEGNTNARIYYNIDVMVMHYEGTNVTQVTSSSTPNISNYHVTWQWDKSSNTTQESSGGMIGSATSNRFQDGGDIPFALSESSNDYKSFMKIMLWTNSNNKKIDTIVIPVTVKSEAVFEVVQGSMPYILSQVTASLTEGDYGEIRNYISTFLQRADEIEAIVTGFDSNGVNQSIIQQTSESVLLQVSNSLSTAGINITNNTITLTGDKTDINGSLNIYGGAGNGFKVWNNVKGSETMSVQISNISLGAVQDYFINNVASNASSVNVIGMDGVAFTPNYNQMLWWGKSNSDSKYEFIVRNKLQNFRIREEGIQRTVYSGAIWKEGNNTIDVSNMSSYSTLGKTLLNGNIDNEYYWQDISSTLPVLTFMGEIDLTTNGQGRAGQFPDINFRRYGIFICVESYGQDRKMYIPHPSKCPGRTIFVKNRGGANLKICIHGNENVFMSADSVDKYPDMEIGYLSTVFVSDGSYWIQFYCG